MCNGFHYKFWVYILSSASGTLYVGIGFFERRLHQHKYDSIEGFTKKYQCHRLVYYESYQGVQVTIAREKQVKRWRREKKIALIEKLNSRWQDLAEKWGREMRFRGQSLAQIPCIGMMMQAVSGSLHSPQSLRSFVVGRDDRPKKECKRFKSAHLKHTSK